MTHATTSRVQDFIGDPVSDAPAVPRAKLEAIFADIQSDMRFDHHHPPLDDDAERSVWYASSSLVGALSESFGRLGFLDREAGRRVIVVRVARTIRLLDLVGVGARAVGLTQEVAATSDHATCQAWARAFYEQYPTLLGIRWRGRQRNLNEI